MTHVIQFGKEVLKMRMARFLSLEMKSLDPGQFFEY